MINILHDVHSYNIIDIIVNEYYNYEIFWVKSYEKFPHNYIFKKKNIYIYIYISTYFGAFTNAPVKQV